VGYAKNPGSFRDTVGVLVVIVLFIEMMIFVVSLWAGTPEMFGEINAILYSRIKEFMLFGVGLVIAVVAIILVWILRTWKEHPDEE
jgi:hypothetical protein